MAELEWSGQEAFVASPLRDWSVSIDDEDVVAGQTRSARGFTWASVRGAGHMVSVGFRGFISTGVDRLDNICLHLEFL